MSPGPRLISWAGLLLLAACGAPEAPPPPEGSDGAPLVVTSIFPIGDLAAFMGGDAAKVEVLLPPRVSASTFEPTVREMSRLSRARAYLFVGGGLDPWAEALVPQGGEALVVRLTEGMELAAAQGHEEVGEAGNPHVWLDPLLVRDRILPRVEAVLTQVAPASATAITARRRALQDSLTALDGEISKLLEAVPSRAFVASHGAWSYFARRYGLLEIGSVFASPGREPSSQGLARLVEAARAAGVRAVFVEPQLGEAGARAVAEELDADPALLDPLGGPGLEGRDSYLGLLRFNARQMAAALGGGA